MFMFTAYLFYRLAPVGSHSGLYACKLSSLLKANAASSCPLYCLSQLPDNWLHIDTSNYNRGMAGMFGDTETYIIHMVLQPNLMHA